MFKFIVDSTFSLDEDFIKKYDIKVVDLLLDMGGKIYHEQDQSSWNGLYEDMLTTTSFPKTSQPSPEDFSNAINYFLEKDKDSEIVILTLSSKLSGTYNCAKMVAKEYTDAKITVIDTLMTSLMCPVFMKKVVEMDSIEDIKNYLKRFLNGLNVTIIPQELVYLKRGGRLNVVAFLIASTLKIRPVINYKEGAMCVGGKIIGRKKALNTLYDALKQPNKKFYIAHVYEGDMLKEFKEHVKELDVKIEEYMPVDPVIGAHVGPGSMGVFAYDEDLFD